MQTRNKYCYYVEDLPRCPMCGHPGRVIEINSYDPVSVKYKCSECNHIWIKIVKDSQEFMDYRGINE